MSPCYCCYMKDRDFLCVFMNGFFLCRLFSAVNTCTSVVLEKCDLYTHAPAAVHSHIMTFSLNLHTCPFRAVFMTDVLYFQGFQSGWV